MASSGSGKGSQVYIPPLTTMVANAIAFRSKKILSSTLPLPSNTYRTIADIDAAMTLVEMSKSGTDQSRLRVPTSNMHLAPISNDLQAIESTEPLSLPNTLSRLYPIISDIDAALILVEMSRSGTNKPKVLIPTSNMHLAPMLSNFQAIESNESDAPISELTKPRGQALNNPQASETNQFSMSTPESNEHPSIISEESQSSETEEQQQHQCNDMAARQRQRRAKKPKGHRKAEYKRWAERETESHRKERLRKQKERSLAKKMAKETEMMEVEET